MRTRAPRVIAAMVLVFAAGGPAYVTACSYDWAYTKSPRPTDAGKPGTDAAVPTFDASVADATIDAAHTVDAATCAALLANVEAAEHSARTPCSEPCAGPMMVPPCGCPYYVAEATGSATSTLESAVAAFNASCQGYGATFSCLPCSPDAGFVSECLPIQFDGGPLTTACVEPQ